MSNTSCTELHLYIHGYITCMYIYIYIPIYVYMWYIIHLKERHILKVKKMPFINFFHEKLTLFKRSFNQYFTRILINVT